MARIEIKVRSDAFRTEITRERLDDIAVTAEAVALLVASFGHRSGAVCRRLIEELEALGMQVEPAPDPATPRR